MVSKKNVGFPTILLLAFSISLMNCKGKPSERYVPIPIVATNSAGEHFVGSEQCASCHIDIALTHSQTAHFKSSAAATENSVLGPIENGKNTYHLNDSIFFKIKRTDSLFFQEIWTTYADSPVYRSKMDIVIGSGTKGQSYLFWKGNGLFQQQVSYHTPSDSWINSPMFPLNKVVRPRAVIPKCIGCHSTYARPLTNNPMTNLYAKSMVLGIDCERCHGPAYKHVVHQTYGDGLASDNIVSFAKMSRQQRLDACALCHSGVGVKVDTNIMEYKMGHPLPAQNSSKGPVDLDVHGNQYGLLIQSQCFKQSDTMDCNTCHNVHKNQRNDNSHFNSICISCHDVTSLTNVTHTLTTYDRCTACHMPLQESKQLMIGNTNNDDPEPLKVRNHLISVYVSDVLSPGNQPN